MVFPTVFAENNTESKKVKVSELPIYDNPEDRYEVQVFPEEKTPFKNGVTEFRKSLFTVLDSFKETTDTIKDKYETGKAHTQQTIEYIRNDPGILPRAGVITVAGLGGIVLGHRGGILRKLFYSSFAVVGATSLCYPNQAVEITQTGYNKAKDHAMSLWNGPDKDKKE